MMLLKQSLKEQYHGGFAMLRQCIERCPDDLWESGSHPRTFWRIAFHAIFYTHLYLQQTEEDFQRWPKHDRDCTGLWGEEPVLPAYTRQETAEYLEFVDRSVDATVEALDLAALFSGFDWYPNISKLSHQFMNVRHLQGHVGQLSELLMARNIDVDWVSRA